VYCILYVQIRSQFRALLNFTDQVLTDHVGLCSMQLLLVIYYRQLHASVMWISVSICIWVLACMCMCMCVFDLVGCELVVAGARNTGGTDQLQLMEQLLSVMLNV
jgi:predicted RND superfamily exporter protein